MRRVLAQMLIIVVALASACTESSSSVEQADQNDSSSQDHQAALDSLSDYGEDKWGSDVVGDLGGDLSDMADGQTSDVPQDSQLKDVVEDLEPDSQEDVGPQDTAETEIVGECQAAGGTCRVALPGMQMDGCATLEQKAELGGCPDGEICCTSIECYPLGGTYESFEDLCCEGLTRIDQCFEEEGLGCTCPNCPCAVCTMCGDGICSGPHENHCNCPGDCSIDPNKECTQAGGVCREECGEGEYSIGSGACSEAGECCVEKDDECVGPGETAGVYPGAPACCPGLKALSPAVMVNGECEFAMGAVTCSPCGNGICEPGWENKCNCPEDCYLDEGECYGPYQPCAEGSYCRYPDASCDSAGATGLCTAVPGDCWALYAPVCGCDGVTYSNECKMEAAMMSKNYDGECLSTEPCVPEGASYNEAPGVACCEGLKAVAQCEMVGDMCACLPCMCYVCTKCGNGLCGPGENICNCPTDCMF